MITAVAISSAGALALAAAGALAYRARCQRRIARSLAINTPNGISESGYVRIGGIDQWIQIRERTAPTRSCCSCTVPGCP